MPAPLPRILVADDQSDIVEAIRLLLKSEGYQVDTVDSPPAVLASLSRGRYDVLLMDLNYARDTTSGREGLDLLAEIQLREHSTSVVVMTAWGSIGLAVEAMQRGARDFVEKPWDNNRLVSILRTQTELARALERSRQVDEQLQRDLDLAREVQQQLLPRGVTPIRGLEYCGMCRPARRVGGDYYDFLPLGDGRLGLVVADIAGKGVSAALLMANLQALLRALAPICGCDAVQLAAALNQQLLASMPGNRYSTLFYAIFDEERLSLTYVNAGHNAPLLVRAADPLRTEYLDTASPILGMFVDAEYQAVTVQLEPGDLLVIYTDGIPEAVDGNERPFGDTRLRSAIVQQRAGAVAAVRDALLDAHAHFVGEADQHDDMTLVVARVV